ncbi:MAG: CDP-alcohol phosphatidyltransferase family protein [Desulfovibrio sp.]|nr:MAG: CDP-alcohol phosphatidyltransferase family protein [Desulfovibrio sp.]
MDYFNARERAKQHAFGAKREQLFAGIIALLIRVKATPNQVSVLGVCFLGLACVLPSQWHWGVAICLVLYVLCDGLDGPLARTLGTAGPGGSLVDMVADQMGVVLLPAAAIHHIQAWGPAMVVFSSAYLCFIALVVYANSQGIKLRPFVRVKYVFFGLYWLSLALQRDLVTCFAALCGAYYVLEGAVALKRMYGFHESRRVSGAAKGEEAREEAEQEPEPTNTE